MFGEQQNHTLQDLSQNPEKQRGRTDCDGLLPCLATSSARMCGAYLVKLSKCSCSTVSCCCRRCCCCYCCSENMKTREQVVQILVVVLVLVVTCVAMMLVDVVLVLFVTC
jgi:hypothetical protein